MPDPVTTQTAPQTSAVIPTPISPTGTPPAAAPPTTTKPAEPRPAAATPAPVVPDLDPQTRMEIPKKDGTGYEEGTLQEMADALLEKRAEILDPDKTKKFEAFQKAVAENDPKAAHDLLDLYMPPADTKPKPVAADERMATVEKELQDIKQLLGRQTPIVRQIEDARIQGGVKNLITQHATNLPHLAKEINDGARRVTAKITEYRDAAKAHLGLSDEQFNNHPRRQQILARAMLDCEHDLKTLADRFRGFDPAATTGADGKAKPGTVAVEDQAATPVDRIPARFQVDGGRLVDTVGQVVTQARHGEMQTVPTEPLAGEPSGTAVGVAPVQQPSGPYDVDQLKANMRKRQQEISTE